MNRRISVIAFAALALAACSPDAVAPPKAPPSGSFEQSVGGSGNESQYLVLMRGESIDAGFDGRVRSLGGKVRRRHDAAGFAAVSGLTDAAAVQLATSPGVSDVLLDPQISLNLPVAPIEADAVILGAPSTSSQIDPTTAILYSWQWNMRAIKANEAWAKGKLGKSKVTVAILDTGIDYDAPDLAGLVDLSRSHSFMNVFVPATPPPTPCVAPGPLCRPSDDSVTKGFFPTRDSISDYNGHGTNVATQVSSKAFAFAGVTSKTTLIGVKVLGSNGVGSLGTVLSGVIWAADHDADVANMSLGGGFPRTGNEDIVKIIRRVFDYAKKKRMLVVVSAGNSAQDLDNNGDTYSTYCDAPHVVCVSSVGPRLGSHLAPGLPLETSVDAPAFYTNFGRRSIDVAAPGGNADAANGFPDSDWPWSPPPDFASWVWSFCSKTLIARWSATNVPNLFPCASGSNITGFIGTSQAAPHAAGLAALLISVTGESKSEEIKEMIEDSADDLGPRGRDAFYGHGRINVARALRYQRRGDNDRDWKKGDRH